MKRDNLKNLIKNYIREYLHSEEISHRKRVKVGVIPFVKYPNEEVIMMFMKPSSSSYGGSYFQIAKGTPKTSNLEEEAIREAEEELGLKKENVKKIISCGKFQLMGLIEEYDLEMFMAEVKNPKDFNKPHYETSEVKWLTISDFLKEGRKSHKDIVHKCHNKIIVT